MTKQEQIEEMAKVMPEKIKDPLDNSRYIIFGKSLRREIARIYYNAGYRKIGKDNIVLSREEYEKLRETISDLRYDKFDLKNEISEKDNKIALLEETIDCIKFNVGFTREETAREILQTLYNYPHEWHEMKIKELAKEYGVEVEK